MSALMVPSARRVLPLWAVITIAGLLMNAVALTTLIAMRAVGLGLSNESRLVLLVAFALGSVVFAIGLGMPLFGSVLRRGPGARLSAGSHRVVLGTTLVMVLVSNVPPTVYALLTSVDHLQSLPGFLLAALSVELTLVAAAYVRLVRSGAQTWRGLGFEPGRLLPDIGRGLVWGIGAFIVSALLQSALDLVGVRQTQLHEFTWIRELDLVGLGLVLAVGAFGAPLAEELYFRGYVFASYLREKGPPVAYVVSGLLFASLHLNKEALLPIFVLGMMLSWMYHRSGSVVPPIVAHAFNNGLAFLVFYFAPSLPI